MLESFDLGGRRAMVTGAGRGIGEACAVGLARAGADLVLVSRSRDELERVAARAEAIGRHAEVAPGDVTSAEDVRAVADRAGRAAYCASKHGVEGLTKAIALELAPRGVRVNAVAPTYIETPMASGLLADPQVRAETVGRIPMGRVGSVDEVVGAVVYLASPAASLVTGASLLVDGGYTAQQR